MRGLLVCVALIMVSCGGNEPRGTPQGAVDHTLTMAKEGQNARAARMLAKPLRGKAVAENQLAPLGYWIWLKSVQKLGLAAGTFNGWDTPRVERESGGTATVTTILRFVDIGGAERPIPVVVDLLVEDGHWRIAGARVSPTPTWFADAAKEAEELGGYPPELVDLATVTDSFRPPPAR